MLKLWFISRIQQLKIHPYIYGFILVFLLLAAISITQFIINYTNEKANERSYTYETMQASNQVIIHVMRTDPKHIQLQSINMSVIDSGFNGINGGFFWLEHLLSIAVENDIPVHGIPKEYGSGWYNAKYPRGTMVYDRISRLFTVQIVSSVDELHVINRSSYWAQGGISMNLSDPLRWESVMNLEALPFATDSRLRSGMVYDQDGFVYLIVSTTKCTAAQFRSAIIELAQQYPIQEGIFLDGDGSSQMQADELKLDGDGRKVTQMIRIN